MNDDKSGQLSSRKSWLSKVGDLFGTQPPSNQSELVELIKAAAEQELVSVETLAIIEGAIEVTDLHVRDIMIPRNQMICLTPQQRIEDMLPIIIDSAHSRYPMLNDAGDKVIGVLLAKDLLALLHSTGFNLNHANQELHSLLRQPYFVPESKRLNPLLKDFRNNRNHLAVVIDEYGGIAGLATIEDVLEEIVGDIEDEHDEEEVSNIREQENGQWLVRALTPIDEFNNQIGSDFSDEEFDTVGGIVLHSFGRMPRKQEQVVIKGLKFEIAQADNRRLHLLKVSALDA